ncbi:5-deoxy-glucuronate isomerase [Cohnella laeviribosi]|uniref:5-deoxy-glucuronate isomerase n=1 Tax=Cohnella laeviribosi TaxID=380174 RepID=UPI000363AC91|nr:5-deoxy-glucuronate isomerase [Cohnella laeviribosi]
MRRFSKAERFNGYRDIFTFEEQGLKYLAFGKAALEAGQTYRADTEQCEAVIVLLKGKATVSTGGKTWNGLGGRRTVFEGKATAVYVPCQSSFVIEAETELEVGICKAKAEKRFEPFVVYPEEVVVHRRGKETWKREVHDIIADNADGRVHRIVLGETFNEPGSWSSYPPHKHDGEHAPEEPDLEEIYYYQVDPEQGFGVQLHYTKDGEIDDAYIVRQGDSFAIDKGYHPVAAAGGYRVYYLWFMAGPTGRTLKPYDDPDHRWLTR